MDGFATTRDPVTGWGPKALSSGRSGQKSRLLPAVFEVMSDQIAEGDLIQID
jgi:hypothetical protein